MNPFVTTTEQTARSNFEGWANLPPILPLQDADGRDVDHGGRIVEVYGSPGTEFSLERAGDSLRCLQTGEEFPLRAGIPNFSKTKLLDVPNENPALIKLNQLAPSRGWREALEETYRDDPRMLRYVTEEGRSTFLDVLPINKQSVVLEIGPGLGQMTTTLAERAKRVYALEIDSEQAAFVAERARQSGLQNVAVACGGDDCRLPYKTNSFDYVVLNLVLEWCASRSPLEDPIVGQQRMLSDIARVLKPNGRLYVSTKNRFGVQYLLGQPDEHVFGMRYGNVLPHPLVRWWLTRTGRGPIAGLLHSYTALSQMLTKAGLGRLQSYWAAPEMRYPSRMVATDACSIREARKAGLEQGFSRRTKLFMSLLPAGVVKYFTPGLAFTACKPA